jgi:ABC-type branched-subunit amino acid transport system ATPase component
MTSFEPRILQPTNGALKGRVMSLLRIEGLDKGFGPLEVLNNLNFGVGKGFLHSVVGPNGADETTFFKPASGILRPTSGKNIFQRSRVMPSPLSEKGGFRHLPSFPAVNP